LKTYDVPVLKFWSRPKIAFAGANALRARKDCGLADRKVANGCILNATGKLKMEIPVGIGHEQKSDPWVKRIAFELHT
jgi:hypothetical protein